MASRKKNFQNSSKRLSKAETTEYDKKAEYEKAKEEKNNCQKKYVIDGLLYYDDKKRADMFEKAKELCYSHESIEKLKSFNKNNWNVDQVTYEEIKSLEAMENFISDEISFWEKSIISKLGKLVNEEDD